MGVGDSLQAPGTLNGPIPAGRWHLVGDAQILKSCDVRYDFRVVHADKTMQPIVEFTHHFDPQSNGGFDAVKYEEDATADAVAAQVGDLLVWRVTILGSTDGGAPVSVYIPNGDGPLTRGRYPSIAIPK